MFSLFLKESLTFHRPVSKWGRQKRCQARHDWKRLLPGAGKGFIWSIYCHGNSECDLEVFLALSQVERLGKKQTLKQGRSRGESSCLGRAPKEMQRALASCQGSVRRPCELGWSGQPMFLLQVAGPDEHSGDLFNIILDMEGPINVPLSHSFCNQSWRAFCARDTAQHRDDKHSLCPPFHTKTVQKKYSAAVRSQTRVVMGGGDLLQSSPYMCPLQGTTINLCNHCLKSQEITPCSEELLLSTSWAHRICTRCCSPRFRNSLSLKGKGCTELLCVPSPRVICILRGIITSAQGQPP